MKSQNHLCSMFEKGMTEKDASGLNSFRITFKNIFFVKNP